ncbi:MAG: Hpt domain-containing protein [Opitutaceae bacterium]|nr:Hpt domain-containing protein [Opitutaceae bacterium]
MSSNSSSSEPIIDAEAIENLRAINPDDSSFLKEIIGIFIEDTPARIAELRTTMANGDVDGFSRAAHSIKGSSSNLGAARLRSLAEHLEHDSKSQPLANFAQGITELEATFAATKSELEQLG